MYTIYFNYTVANNTWEDFVAYNRKPTELGMFALKQKLATQLGVTPWGITVTGWEKNS
mgnify:FL=1